MPDGGLGEATIKRELFARLADPDEITHIFKYKFNRFSDLWRSKFGWDLFLPLREDDTHSMKSLHVPTSEEPLEFNQQILALAKILPDSINVSKIKGITGLGDDEVKKLFDLSEDNVIGSMYWLKTIPISYFNVYKTIVKDMLQPLKSIQSLRPSGSAYRKGSTYDKTVKRYGLIEKSYI
ncbi:MAG: hypothetical protein JRI84_11940 [Deltaproteobacteria bacterium]|nr:hypothetical protein [Deltaproteobacteria bacterium]